VHHFSSATHCTLQTPSQSWLIECDRICVWARVTVAPVDQVEQLLKETIKIEVEDHCKTRMLSTTNLKRAIILRSCSV
jgi:hypothetical protein